MKYDRPTLSGCSWYSKLNADALDHWVYEACCILGSTPPSRSMVSVNAAFLKQFFDEAEINLRCAGLLGWTAHWIDQNYKRTPDYCDDTFLGAWCQAFAAKYCSQEQVDADRIRASRADAAPKRERKVLVAAPTRRSLFD